MVRPSFPNGEGERKWRTERTQELTGELLSVFDMDPGPSSMDIAPVSVPSGLRHRSSRVYYCCVPECRNRSINAPDLSFHRFPNVDSRKEVRKAWIVAIRRDEGKNFKVIAGTRVCSAHFLPGDFKQSPYASITSSGRKILLPEAVPSIFAWRLKDASTPRRPPRERGDAYLPPAKRRCRRSASTVKVTSDIGASSSSGSQPGTPVLAGDYSKRP